VKFFTFSFDDGYESWMRASRLLEKYRYRGSFNVCLRNTATRRLVNRRLRMWPDTLLWTEIQELADRGHEICSHGVRHIDYVDATDEELLMEIEGSKRVFASRGIEVDAFTCPFNGYTSQVGKLCGGHYSYVRGGSMINTLPIYVNRYHSTGAEDALESIAEDVWVVGAWHDVEDFREFEAAIQQVEASGATVVTVQEMFEYAKRSL